MPHQMSDELLQTRIDECRKLHAIYLAALKGVTWDKNKTDAEALKENTPKYMPQGMDWAQKMVEYHLQYNTATNEYIYTPEGEYTIRAYKGMAFIHIQAIDLHPLHPEKSQNLDEDQTLAYQQALRFVQRGEKKQAIATLEHAGFTVHVENH